MLTKTEATKTHWVAFSSEQIADLNLIVKIIDGHGLNAETLTSIIRDVKMSNGTDALETWQNFKETIGEL